jgi:hypothetical protein
MPVKRRILAFASVLVVALALAASTWAGTTTYAVWSYWSAGQGAGTSFSPSWWRNVFYKTAYFDTTVTFIDNASYAWHATVRSSGTYVETHWFSSQVKKAHCRANAVGSYGACTAYN